MPFTSRVLAVEGQTLIVRKRSTKTVRLEPGVVLSVFRHRRGGHLVDPDTGRVIGKREKKIGEFMLTSHQGDRIS